ncbi:SSI family serine proteinase inhibitor [Streptomyces xiamenensis]|uniref:SSI family serine proteinase inhibitor n=1 Tax=Streptomyces xiamenensis TaxID=408015 RepID=UPI0037D68C72
MYSSSLAALVLAALAGTAQPAPAPAPTHELTITVSDHGSADGVQRLRCSPAGGDHPRAADACAAIEAARTPFAPLADGTLCTRVYGGPATARVEGVWDGQRVAAEFNRTDGCEIARWDALVPALPPVGNHS